MIDFKIDGKMKTYKIMWTESKLNKLYFLVKPIKPVKIIQDDELILDYNYEKYVQKFDILKSLSDSAVALPLTVRQSCTTYKFELYSNPQYAGEPLRKNIVYLGSKKSINMVKRTYEDGIIQVCIKCNIKIPKDLFWLEFSDLHDIPFYLPPMEKENNLYETSCLMPLEAYKKWELCLDEKIMDYMEISKKE